jgi:hypothetical protein
MLDEYISIHFPDNSKSDFSIWETGMWNFEEVWPDAVELTESFGDDFSYRDGFKFAVWRHLRLYDVWHICPAFYAPTWRCKHCGFWCDVWDYYPIEIHLMVKCQQVKIFTLNKYNCKI